MENITKIENGFIFRNVTRLFKDILLDEENSAAYEILSDTAAHVGTNKGVIRIETSLTVDNVAYSNITDLITNLYA